MMTSRERVEAAFRGAVPDRVPVNYSANEGIDARLKKHFGLRPDDDDGLSAALGVDFRTVSAPYAGPPLHEEAPRRRVNPLWGIRTRWIEHESGGYWDYCDFPLAGASLAAVEAWPMPSPDDFDYGAVPPLCRRYRDLAVGLGSPGLGDVINSSGMLRGVENVLIDLATDDAAGLRLMDRRTEINVEITRRTLEAAEGAVTFLWLGEDLGTQRGPLIGPELFRRHIRPRLQRYVDLGKAFDIPVMVHSCGSSSWAYEDFIEMGVSVVDTLQPEAADMSPRYLKERFGGRLTFHGCISTAGPVANGTVEEVERNVRETLEIMMPGGGYSLAPTHSLQDNSPTENVLALYAAAAKYGRY